MMKKIAAILLTLAFALTLLGGCAEQKDVSVGAGGAISENGADAEASEPTPEPTAAPTPTEAPTPTPTEAPGWSYRFDRVLLDEENVRFTLQTMEYDFETKTLTVVADYADTGPYSQLVIFVNVIFGETSYTLYADTSAEEDNLLILSGGEECTVSFSVELTDEDLAETDVQHATSVLFDLSRLEADDPSDPNTFGIHCFDNVEVELPPAA